MRKISLLATGVAVLALAACSEASKDMTAPNDASVLYAKNPTPTYNPNGPVWVSGQFSLNTDYQIEGTAPGINAHPQGFGFCADEFGVPGNSAVDTVWYNNPNHPTNAPFCKGSVVSVASVTLCSVDAAGLPATYAYAGGGNTGYPPSTQTGTNENINFHSDSVAQSIDQFVHYQGKANATTGKSYTIFTFSCDDGVTFGQARIDLSQFNGAGNRFSAFASIDSRKISLPGGALIQIDVSDPSGGNTLGTTVGMSELSWVFRSRLI
jgi:hypothetical protein